MAKKTTTVETPIDKRETFVSIRKKFADSADTISEKLNTLYQLQLTDTAIDRIVRLRGELPLEVETLENELEQMQEADYLRSNYYIVDSRTTLLPEDVDVPKALGLDLTITSTQAKDIDFSYPCP